MKLGEKFMIFVILTQIGLKVQSKRSEVLDEDVMNRIQAKAKLITEKEGFKVETLPIVSSHKRNVPHCQGQRWPWDWEKSRAVKTTNVFLFYYKLQKYNFG